MRLLVVAAFAFGTQAMAADQFDLVCKSGQSTTHYRVDLSKREACSDTCDRVWKTGEATSGEVRLIDRSPAYRGDIEERSVVNRSSGEWRYRSALGGRSYERTGICELAPFTGFPLPKF